VQIAASLTVPSATSRQAAAPSVWGAFLLGDGIILTEGAAAPRGSEAGSRRTHVLDRTTMVRRRGKNLLRATPARVRQRYLVLQL